MLERDLAISFLRHIERTKLLLHLVDVSSASGREPVTDYQTVNRELTSYNPELAARPQIVVATKIDALDDESRLGRLRERAEADGKLFVAISSVTNNGISQLVKVVAVKLDELKARDDRKVTVEVDFVTCAPEIGSLCTAVHLIQFI